MQLIKFQAMCCGKPTIAVTTMQKHHDNDKIEAHNHKYPLLYKEAKIPVLRLGRFLQALVLCLIYTQSPLGVVRIYQAKHSCLCYSYIAMFQ